MPFVITPSELEEQVTLAEESFDPEIHGRFDFAAPPRCPLDERYDSEDFLPSLHDQIRKGENYYYDRIMYARLTEQIVDVLQPEEMERFSTCINFINGKDSLGVRINDYWNPTEIKSLYLYYAYSPDTCKKASEAIRNTRFLDFFKIAYDRDFKSAKTGEIIYSKNELWEIISSDCERLSGLKGIERMERGLIAFFNYCAKNQLAYIEEPLGL